MTTASTSPSPSITANLLSPGRFILLVVALLFAFYPQVFLGEQTFFFRDYTLFGYPLAHYHRDCFWRGELPLWNPLNECGVPHLAQWNTMTLYPLSVFYLLLPLEWSLGIFCLLHLVWAALGMFMLVRHWTDNALAAGLAGVAFTFNGLALNCLMWPNNVAALAWMPWVVLNARRGWREGGRSWLLAVAVGTVQMLSGAPEFILFTWVVVAALGILDLFEARERRRQTACRLAGMILFVGALSAVQLFPFLDLLGHSHRADGLGDASWAMPPWGWANFLLPGFQTFTWLYGVRFQPDQGWTSSYYLAMGPLVLAVLAPWLTRRREVRILWWQAAAALLLALGHAGYVYSLFARIFPPINLVRFPVKFVALIIFLVPMLAGLAADRLLADFPEGWRQRRRHLSWLPTGLALLLVLLAWADAGAGGSLRPNLWQVVLRLFFLGIFLFGLWLAARKALPAGVLGWTFGLLIFLDVYTHAPNQNPTVNRDVFERRVTRPAGAPEPGQGRILSRHEKDYWMPAYVRNNAVADVLSKRLGEYGLNNLLDDVAKCSGYYSLHLREMRDINYLLYESPEIWPTNLLAFLGVVLTPVPGKLVEWQQFPHPLPLVTGGQRPVFLEPAEILARIFSPAFAPMSEVYLAKEAQADFPARKQAMVKVAVGKFSLRRWEFNVTASAPAVVVIAQAFHPGWQARVDGTPVRLWRANYAFQALTVPEGTHQVSLAYHDRSFCVGAGISLVGGLAWLWAWRRTSRRGPLKATSV